MLQMTNYEGHRDVYKRKVMVQAVQNGCTNRNGVRIQLIYGFSDSVKETKEDENQARQKENECEMVSCATLLDCFLHHSHMDHIAASRRSMSSPLFSKQATNTRKTGASGQRPLDRPRGWLRSRRRRGNKGRVKWP